MKRSTKTKHFFPFHLLKKIWVYSYGVKMKTPAYPWNRKTLQHSGYVCYFLSTYNFIKVILYKILAIEVLTPLKAFLLLRCFKILFLMWINRICMIDTKMNIPQNTINELSCTVCISTTFSNIEFLFNVYQNWLK